jgi:dihydrofolate synthase / folylpolyglutamate synthase
MLLLLDRLGNPQIGRRTVHIAGTKGKGSTAAMISSVLSAGGYRTGLFTSPHLMSWQERIAIGGRPISKAAFAGLVAELKPHVELINKEQAHGKLTTFEVLTAMAFHFFRERHVDFQVLEAGMGGRLDSTNVIDHPDICILTSISPDHTQVLGDTLAKISTEKAGIIKAGCTAVSAPQPPEAMRPIVERCEEFGVRLLVAGRDVTWNSVRNLPRGQECIVLGHDRSYRLFLPLLGDYQMENAALVIAALEVLKQKGVRLPYKDIARGFKSVSWPVRLEVLSRSPLLVVDGAHNPYSFGRVIQSIRKLFHYDKAYVIFGSSQDKDVPGMARELASFADTVVLTTSAHQRAARPDYLAAVLRKEGLSTVTTADPARALDEALSKAGNNDLVLGAGSLFLAAEIKEAFAARTSGGMRRGGDRR